MKLHSVGVRIVATAFLSLIGLGAYGQVVEQQAWRSLSPNPSGEPFVAKTIGADINGNTYTLETQNTGNFYPWIVYATDKFGVEDYTRSAVGNEPAFGMAVDYYSGDYFVLTGKSGGYTVNGYLANGFQWNSGLGAITPLAISFDPDDGQVKVAYNYDNGFYVTAFSEDGFVANDSVNDPSLSPTYASFDTYGNAFAWGATTAGKVAGKLFDFNGQLEWTRAFTNSSTDTYSIGGYAVDQYGNEYIAVNDLNTSSGDSTFTWDQVNGSTNTFNQNGSGKAQYFAVGDINHVYVAGTGASEPFLDMFTNTGLVWSNAQLVQSMGISPDGSVLVAAYEPTYKDVVAHKYSATGASQYSFYWEANSNSDVANIQWVLDGNTWPSVYIAGATTPSSGSAVVMIKYLEGTALKSATYPASLVGGQAFTAAYTLTAASTSYYYLQVDGEQLVNVSGGQLGIPPNKTSYSTTGMSYGVDSSQQVTITTSDARGMQILSNMTIEPASLLSLTLSSSSVTPDAPLTGTVKLNGQAGPSGVAVAISSDSASAIVPSSVAIDSYTTSNTFQITTKPVSTSTLAHITAKYGSITETQALTLTPPVLSLLSPATVTVIGGNKANLEVWLNGEPAAPVVVTLKSSNTAALPVPATVTIPANTSNVTFTLTSNTVATNTSVTVTARYGSVSKTSVFTVEP